MGISNGYRIGLKYTDFCQNLCSVAVWHCTFLEQVLGGTTPMQFTLLKHVLHHCSLDWASHSIWKRSLEIQDCELNVRQNCWIFWRSTNPIVFQETIAKERVEILCLKVSIETSSGCCQMSKTGSGHARMWREWQK